MIIRSIASLQTRRTMSTLSSGTPVNLVTCNAFPDRAKKVVGQVIEQVKDKYNIVYAGNSDTIEGVRPLLLSIQPPPDILFAATMWTPEQQQEIQHIARHTIPGIKTHAAPAGLQAQAGIDGVVKHLVGQIDEIMKEK